MTGKVNALPQDQFIAAWNAAATLDAAVDGIQALVGRPCPKWAVMARALACRKDGEVLKRFDNPVAKAAG